MASLTPPMHEAEAAALGLDYEYRIFDLIELGRPATDVGALLAEAKRRGFAAMNITHPCKQLVLDIVDELDPDAEHLGAVNLVVFDARPSHRIQHRLDGVPGRADRRAAGGVVRPGRAGGMRRRRRGDRLRAPLVRHIAARPVRRRDRPRARTSPSACARTSRSRPSRPCRRASFPRRSRRATGVVHATPVGMLHHPGVAFDLAFSGRVRGCRMSCTDRSRRSSSGRRPSGATPCSTAAGWPSARHTLVSRSSPARCPIVTGWSGTSGRSSAPRSGPRAGGGSR